MPRTICERALARALAYLQWSGLELSSAVCLEVLQLVEQVLKEHADDPMDRIMERLPAHFTLPGLERPPVTPPLRRASIGYHDY